MALLSKSDAGAGDDIQVKESQARMKRKYLILAGTSLLLAVLLLTFRTPYFTPVTGWQTYDGQQYRAETWHSNTFLATDRVRLVLRDKSGALRAASPDGYLKKIDCAKLDACIIYFYTRDSASEVYPLASWILEWPAAAANPARLPEMFDSAPLGFAVHTRANNYITGNICFSNPITSVLWYMSLLFSGLLLVTGIRAQPKWRGYYLALLVGLPAYVGVISVAFDPILTYQKMMLAAAVITIPFFPVWAICWLYYRSLMRNPQKKLKPRAIAYGFLAVLCLSFPFAQQAIQNISTTDEPVQDLNLNLTPSDGG